MLIVAVVVFVKGCSGPQTGTLLPTGIAPLRTGIARGANVTAYSADALDSPAAVLALQQLRATGADHVAFPILWFQADKHATAIAPDALQTPSDESILAAMATAHNLGMTVTLAPHLNVRDGTFRGVISPSSKSRWYAAYGVMLDHFADLAKAGGARTLVVGSELTSMSKDTEAWQTLIARARARFSGRLTFAANWVQGAETVKFWKSLDAIGIDAYMPLTPGVQDPSVAQIEEGWRPWLKRMRALHARTGKPIELTELGFTSRLGAAAAPATEGKGAISQSAQSRGYQATFAVLDPQPWLTATYLWEWSADGRADPAGGDYSPQGKSAQQVLRRWYGGLSGT